MQIAHRLTVGQRRVTIEEGVEQGMEFVDGPARLSRSPPNLERHAPRDGHALLYQSGLAQPGTALDNDDAATTGASLLEAPPNSVDLLVAAPQRISQLPLHRINLAWPSNA